MANRVYRLHNAFSTWSIMPPLLHISDSAAAPSALFLVAGVLFLCRGGHHAAASVRRRASLRQLLPGGCFFPPTTVNCYNSSRIDKEHYPWHPSHPGGKRRRLFLLSSSRRRAHPALLRRERGAEGAPRPRGAEAVVKQAQAAEP